LFSRNSCPGDPGAETFYLSREELVLVVRELDLGLLFVLRVYIRQQRLQLSEGLARDKGLFSPPGMEPRRPGGGTDPSAAAISRRRKRNCLLMRRRLPVNIARSHECEIPSPPPNRKKVSAAHAGEINSAESRLPLQTRSIRNGLSSLRPWRADCMPSSDRRTQSVLRHPSGR
jgi:hypothetical protein